jgi:hypothetical protein
MSEILTQAEMSEGSTDTEAERTVIRENLLSFRGIKIIMPNRVAMEENHFSV